jgi:hypothetical protein
MFYFKCVCVGGGGGGGSQLPFLLGYTDCI